MNEKGNGEFSFRTREKAIQRFREDVFDLLIVGGGITGAAVARDAASRGLRVALVEKRDFAYGTSSRSSKLIHGGLRYLENFELGLVFEALSERALLLKTAPHLVKPLPFYWPVYEGDANGRWTLSAGLWLYDLLALLRAPGFHRGLSKDGLLEDIPFLKKEGLKGGFRYFDASMSDDVLVVETVRAASEEGAAVANYVEAVEPLWKEEQIVGFKVRDLESSNGHSELNLRAHKTVICAGPWTDQVGMTLQSQWKRWLTPSKGIHLIFDLKRIPIPGALVMSNQQDGRISFVIPRPDYGSGVVIVGTTDGPTDQDPDRAEVQQDEVQYLLDRLQSYFPDLHLTRDDVISAYVGVRPLMGRELSDSDPALEDENAPVLQKVSREHHMDVGPGGTVIVAGGKYTTHRKMAEEIVNFTLKSWKKDEKKYPEFHCPSVRRPNTKKPVNPFTTPEALQFFREEAVRRNIEVPEELVARFGSEALSIFDRADKNNENPAGFPMLDAQLAYAIQSEMVVHLEDFYLRRIPLYASRKDHGLPWGESLSKIWAKERHLSETEAQAELERLKVEVQRRDSWVSK